MQHLFVFLENLEAAMQTAFHFSGDIAFQKILDSGTPVGYRVYVEDADLVFFINLDGLAYANHMGLPEDVQFNINEVDAIAKILADAIAAA